MLSKLTRMDIVKLFRTSTTLGVMNNTKILLYECNLAADSIRHASLQLRSSWPDATKKNMSVFKRT